MGRKEEDKRKMQFLKSSDFLLLNKESFSNKANLFKEVVGGYQIVKSCCHSPDFGIYYNVLFLYPYRSKHTLS